MCTQHRDCPDLRFVCEFGKCVRSCGWQNAGDTRNYKTCSGSQEKTQRQVGNRCGPPGCSGKCFLGGKQYSEGEITWANTGTPTTQNCPCGCTNKVCTLCPQCEWTNTQTPPRTTKTCPTNQKAQETTQQEQQCGPNNCEGGSCTKGTKQWIDTQTSTEVCLSTERCITGECISQCQWTDTGKTQTINKTCTTQNRTQAQEQKEQECGPNNCQGGTCTKGTTQWINTQQRTTQCPSLSTCTNGDCIPQCRWEYTNQIRDLGKACYNDKTILRKKEVKQVCGPNNCQGGTCTKGTTQWRKVLPAPWDRQYCIGTRICQNAKCVVECEWEPEGHPLYFCPSKSKVKIITPEKCGDLSVGCAGTCTCQVAQCTPFEKHRIDKDGDGILDNLDEYTQGKQVPEATSQIFRGDNIPCPTGTTCYDQVGCLPQCKWTQTRTSTCKDTTTVQTITKTRCGSGTPTLCTDPITKAQKQCSTGGCIDSSVCRQGQTKASQTTETDCSTNTNGKTLCKETEPGKAECVPPPPICTYKLAGTIRTICDPDNPKQRILINQQVCGPPDCKQQGGLCIKGSIQNYTSPIPSPCPGITVCKKNTSGDDTCETPPPPKATQVRASLSHHPTCGNPELKVSWKPDIQTPGATQRAYRIQVATDSAFTNKVADIGKKPPTTPQNPNPQAGIISPCIGDICISQRSIDIESNPQTNQVGYNTTYYIRVKIQDTNTQWQKNWTEANPVSFKTPQEGYPNVKIVVPDDIPTDTYFGLSALKISSYTDETDLTYEWTIKREDRQTKQTTDVTQQIIHPTTPHTDKDIQLRILQADKQHKHTVILKATDTSLPNDTDHKYRVCTRELTLSLKQKLLFPRYTEVSAKR